MSGFELTERYHRVINAIVKDYIKTAEPVSSKAVVTNYSFGLSPATIRNIMAELEDAGFLVQPHTSAGRVPTDKSFRLYIDSLRELEELPQGQKELLEKTCGGVATIEEVLTETARALSMLTHCAGLMIAPRPEGFVIKQINLVPMDGSCTGIMVVMVSTLGMVETRVVRMEPGIDKPALERISNYLNSMAEGLTMRELRARVVEEMKKEKNLYDELLSKALSLGAMALEGGDRIKEADLYLEGRVNIFDQPDFKDDFERMKKIFAAFEEKSLLVRILDKSLDESGMHIYLGSESLVKEFEGLSFVTAPYGRNGEILGTLGVIGPVRMNYSRIIPLVDYTAGLLSKVF